MSLQLLVQDEDDLSRAFELWLLMFFTYSSVMFSKTRMITLFNAQSFYGNTILASPYWLYPAKKKGLSNIGIHVWISPSKRSPIFFITGTIAWSQESLIAWYFAFLTNISLTLFLQRNEQICASWCFCLSYPKCPDQIDLQLLCTLSIRWSKWISLLGCLFERVLHLRALRKFLLMCVCYDPRSRKMIFTAFFRKCRLNGVQRFWVSIFECLKCLISL